MKKAILTTLCLLLLSAACLPLPEITKTTTTQVQAGGLPTDTPTPLPSATSTFTPETSTSASTETPTNTPDLQVIAAKPEDFACTKHDLPRAGRYGVLGPDQNYYAIMDHLVPHFTNEKLLTARRYYADYSGNPGIVEKFIKDTKRIDGWWVAFVKLNDSYAGFASIQCIVENFQSIEGAQLAVQKYNDAEFFSYYTYLDSVDRSIGDVSVAIARNLNSEEAFYQISFSYRNYRVSIIGKGTANIGDLYDVGEQVLEKLKDAPLSPP